MKRACWLMLCLLAFAPAKAREVLSAPVIAQGTTQALFAPWDNIEGAISDAIGDARQQVLVQAYLLTSKKIGATLVAAHRRGVDVRVLVDARQLDKVATSRARELAKVGILVRRETKYQNAHNKLVIIDAQSADAIVITGSYNFTWTAQHRNAENILILRGNPKMAARYAANWERHFRESVDWSR